MGSPVGPLNWGASLVEGGGVFRMGLGGIGGVGVPSSSRKVALSVNFGLWDPLVGEPVGPLNCGWGTSLIEGGGCFLGGHLGRIF